MDTMKIYRDMFSLENIPTKILLDTLDSTRYFADIYKRISECSTIVMDIPSFFLSDYVDMFYCDFSYYTYKQNLFEDIAKPCIIVSRPDVYYLDESKWETIDCEGLVIHHNTIEGFNAIREFNSIGCEPVGE
jgi:hypothetical protein